MKHVCMYVVRLLEHGHLFIYGCIMNYCQSINQSVNSFIFFCSRTGMRFRRSMSHRHRSRCRRPATAARTGSRRSQVRIFRSMSRHATDPRSDAQHHHDRMASGLPRHQTRSSVVVGAEWHWMQWRRRPAENRR